MAVLNPLPNNGSQLERAIRAWLIAATADNASANQLRAEEIFVTNDSRTRNNAIGIITLLASKSDHEPEFSGNESWQVAIQLVYPAANQPSQSNPELNRVLIDQKIGLVDAAMQQSNGGEDYDVTRAGITENGRLLKTTGSAMDKSNNDDMDAFTCLFVRYLGSSRGHPVDADGIQDRSFWIESRSYRITAGAANVD